MPSFVLLHRSAQQNLTLYESEDNCILNLCTLLRGLVIIGLSQIFWCCSEQAQAHEYIA